VLGKAFPWIGPLEVRLAGAFEPAVTGEAVVRAPQSEAEPQVVAGCAQQPKQVQPSGSDIRGGRVGARTLALLQPQRRLVQAGPRA
jgi:hypothetical protein